MSDCARSQLGFSPRCVAVALQLVVAQNMVMTDTLNPGGFFGHANAQFSVPVLAYDDIFGNRHFASIKVVENSGYCRIGLRAQMWIIG